MRLKKPFNEMSILFPLLTLFSLIYLGLMIYDFVAKEAFKMPAGMMAVYIGLVGAYAADKEIRRWLGKGLESRSGAYFVYAWMLFFLTAFVIYSFKREYELPKDLIAVTLQVLGIFFGSKASKKIYEVKQDKKEEALSREGKVIAYLKEHKEGKNSDFAKILGVSESTVRRILKKMEAKGLIEQHGEKKATTYTLKEMKETAKN